MTPAKRSFKTLSTAMAATVCFAAMVPLSATTAQAHDVRHWHEHQHHHHVYRHGHPQHKVYRHYKKRHAPRVVRRHDRVVDDSGVAAAAILGLVGGAIIAGALSQSQTLPSTVQPAPPQPHINTFPATPQRIGSTNYSGIYEPWTAEWHSWCNARYRSFNAQTGTYRGYDGYDHFCVPK